MAFFFWTLLVVLVVGLMLCCVCCCWQRIKALLGGQDLKRANAKRQQSQEQELSTKRKSNLGTSSGSQDTDTPSQKKRKTSTSQAVSSGPNASSSPPGTSSQGTSPPGTSQGGSSQGSTPQGASTPTDSVIIRMKHQARRSAPEANAHPYANSSNPNYNNRQAPPPVYQNPYPQPRLYQQSPTRYTDRYRTNYPTRPQSAGPRLGYNPTPTRQSYSPAMNNPANRTYQAANPRAQWNANQLAPNDQRIQKAEHKGKNFLKKAYKHKNPFKWFIGKKKDKGQYQAPPEPHVVPTQVPNVPTYVSPNNPPSPQNDGTKKKKKGGFGFGFFKRKNKSFKADKVPSKVDPAITQVMEAQGTPKKGRKEKMKNWWKKKVLRKQPKEIPAITGQDLPPPPSPQEDKKSPVNVTPRPRVKGTYQVAEIPAFQGPKKDKPVTIVKDSPVQDFQESREILDAKPSTKYDQVTVAPPPPPPIKTLEVPLNEQPPQPSPQNRNLEVAIYNPRPQPSLPKLIFNVPLNELLPKPSPPKFTREMAINEPAQVKECFNRCPWHQDNRFYADRVLLRLTQLSRDHHFALCPKHNPAGDLREECKLCWTMLQKLLEIYCTCDQLCTSCNLLMKNHPNLDLVCCKDCKKLNQMMQRTDLEDCCPVHNLHPELNCAVCVPFVQKVQSAYAKYLQDPANIEKNKEFCVNYCKVHELLACDTHMHNPKPGCDKCKYFNDRKHDAMCTCDELCQDCDANIRVKNHPGLTKACCEVCYLIRAVLNARITDAQPCGQHLHHPVDRTNAPCTACIAFLGKIKHDFKQHLARQAALAPQNRCPIFCEKHQRLACSAHKVFAFNAQCPNCRAYCLNKAGILCTCEDLCLRCCMLVKNHRSPNVTKPCCVQCDRYWAITFYSKIDPCYEHHFHPNPNCDTCKRYLSLVTQWDDEQRMKNAKANREERLD